MFEFLDLSAIYNDIGEFNGVLTMCAFPDVCYMIFVCPVNILKLIQCKM